MSIDLSKIDTRAPENMNKGKMKDKTLVLHDEMLELQRLMYAQGKYSMLIILQGMDAAGKDGAVRRIFGGVNPLGCSVHGFKAPTKEELAHDFLWRVHQNTPERGMIQIFNRSHYEDILVPSVEKYIDADLIKKRYEHINNFEKLLTDHDTFVLKFYLHISPETQRERLEERLHNREKYWKHNDGDRESREKWDAYMNVYHEIFEKTNTRHAPWHIIPADQNWHKVYQITKIIHETMKKKMKLAWPHLESEKFEEEK